MDMAPAASPGLGLVRNASEHDIPEMIAMIGGLAQHHGDVPEATPDGLRRDLFGRDPWAMGLVADSAAGLSGYAILLRLYHAQTGKRGIDLRHLFVVERACGAGIGRSPLGGVVRVAERLRCGLVRIGIPEDRDAQRSYEPKGFRCTGRRSPVQSPQN